MPRLDPETGKQVGGAQKQRERKARELAARPISTRSEGIEWSQVPKPPIGDPIAAMGWWNDILMACADNVLREPVMDTKERAKLLADFAAKAGMIRDKAAESKAMLQALRKRDEDKIAHGLEPNEHRPKPPPVPRPTRRTGTT